MKQPIRTFAFRILLSVGPLFVGPLALAQYGVPLNLQGLNHASMHSAASRGLGGITLTVTNDISLMLRIRHCCSARRASSCP